VSIDWLSSARQQIASPGTLALTSSFTSAPEKPLQAVTHSVARNVLSNWAGLVFVAGISFFLSPFIVRHLGDVGYGVWSLVTSLTGYLGLLDLGVRGAVTRYVARFHAQAKHEDSQRVVSSALVIFLGAGAVAVFVSVAVAFFGIRFFQVPPDYRRVAQIVLVIAGLHIAVSVISGVFGGIVVGLRRFDITNGIEIVSMGLRSLLIVLFLRAGYGLVTLALLHFGFAVLIGIVYAVIAFRLYSSLQLTLRAADKDRLRLILAFSTYSFLLQLSTYLVYYTDSLVIGVYLPVSAVTFFAIAGNLMNYARAPISSISVTLTPHASVIEAKEEPKHLQRVSLLAARYCTAVMLPIAVTFLLRGQSFIALWMGERYALLSSKVLTVLTLAWMFSAGNQALTGIMMGISRHKALAPVALGEAGLNLVLSIILLKRMGIVGVAWGTSLPSLAVHTIFWPLYVRAVLKISIRRYIFSTWVRNVFAGVPFFLTTYGIERFWPASNLAMYFTQVALALPLLLIGSWAFVLDEDDRQKLWQKLRPASSA
jgi:O-antigen/teichoic acid export membrane protein